MKKIIAFVLIVCISLSLTGCFNDTIKDSLDEYIDTISKGDELNNTGFSSMGIDDPDKFLPSLSFLTDYEYLEGTYFYRLDDNARKHFLNEGLFPEIAILALKYDETTYAAAKQTMLEEIKPYIMKPYEDEFFQYNNYYFYLNSWGYHFPKLFTMACYNDENCTLIFIGFSSSTKRETNSFDEKYKKKYLEDIKKNRGENIPSHPLSRELSQRESLRTRVA